MRVTAEDLLFSLSPCARRTRCLVHHLLVFVIAKMGDHHILAQPAVDLFRILVGICR